jgi:hypothetical protein
MVRFAQTSEPIGISSFLMLVNSKGVHTKRSEVIIVSISDESSLAIVTGVQLGTILFISLY